MANQVYAEIAKNTKGKKVMMIGSSGNIGGKALDILLKHGKAASITAFDKRPPKVSDLPKNVTVFSGADANITDAGAIKKAVADNDIIVCAIGVPRYPAPGEKKLTPDEIEVGGMKNILDAAKAGKVKQIIYISALGVGRGDKIPAFHVGHIAKREAENLLMKSGISYTILRPSGYFFDFRDLLAAAVAGRYHVVDKGDSRVQPIHQDDMADILVASINNKKVARKILPIGGLEISTFRELGLLFGKIMKKDVKVISLAPERYKREYFNSEVILFRATSDSILTAKELKDLTSSFPGLKLQKLEDYLNNPDDPMLKSFFGK